MEREVATQLRDRPHRYQPAHVEGVGMAECKVCDRWADDPLHGEVAREVATSHSADTLPRETGS